MSDAERSRTLVLCFDGTGDRFDGTPTNVIRLLSLLDKSSPKKQLVYYQPGIGTYTGPGIWSPTMNKVSKVLDQAVAWYLGAHIMGGYIFLMENWREGDKICLFGFSRGAYTARCLAGMIHKVGLLSRSNIELVSFAYRLYSDTSPEGTKRARGFKLTFSAYVCIDFVGCWDTVASVGALIPRHLPFTSSNRSVKTFRHALALDEHRAKFKANVWHDIAPSAQAAFYDPEAGSPIKDQLEANVFKRAWQHAGETLNKAIPGVGTSSTKPVTVQDASMHEEPTPEEDEYPGRNETDVKEVWFAGCHADVGGGSVKDDVIYSLANPSLRWMISETIRQETGILFKEKLVKSFGVDPTTGDSTFRHNPVVQKGKALPKHESSRGLHIFPSTTKRNEEISDSPVQVGGIILAPHGTQSFDQMKRQDSMLQKAEVVGRNLASLDIPGTYQDSIPRLIKDEDDVEPHDPKTSFVTTVSTEEEAATTATAELHKNPNYQDALSQEFDQLQKNPILWWPMELFPMRQYYQDRQGEWHRSWMPNFFQPRTIHTKSRPLYFHTSVKLRMEAVPGYKPRAKYTGDPVWID